MHNNHAQERKNKKTTNGKQITLVRYNYVNFDIPYRYSNCGKRKKKQNKWQWNPIFGNTNKKKNTKEK